MSFLYLHSRHHIKLHTLIYMNVVNMQLLFYKMKEI